MTPPSAPRHMSSPPLLPRNDRQFMQGQEDQNVHACRRAQAETSKWELAARGAGEGQTDDQTPSSSPVPVSETGPFAQKARVPCVQVPASPQCGPLRYQQQERRGLCLRISLADGKRVLRLICPDPAPPPRATASKALPGRLFSTEAPFLLNRMMAGTDPGARAMENIHWM